MAKQMDDILFLCDVSEGIYIQLEGSIKENWFESFVEKEGNKRDMDFKVFMRDKFEACNKTFAYFKKLTRISPYLYKAHLEYAGSCATGNKFKWWDVYIDECGHILYVDKLDEYISNTFVKRYYHEDLKKIDIEFEDSSDVLEEDMSLSPLPKSIYLYLCSWREIWNILCEVVKQVFTK